VFVVRREHLADLHDRIQPAGACVLLRPTGRATLRSFLTRAVERLRASRSGLTSDDPRRHDRDQLLDSLLLAVLQLQRHNRERTNFLTRALHDFQAPLTASSGYCGLLLHQQMGSLNSDQLELLRHLQHNLAKLGALARTMLDLSAGQPEESGHAIAPNDIEACMVQAIEQVLPLAEQGDIDVKLDIAAQPAFPFDPAQISQVMQCLLENACRFTPTHGSIEVKGYPVAWAGRQAACSANGSTEAGDTAPTAYRVDIKDSGPAIPPDQMRDIFGQYRSYAGGQDRSGTGLGLATCRMIVAAHSGEILAESRSDGAMFSFVLPLSPREAEEGPEGAAASACSGPFLLSGTK
jgi:Amt family ammonium transporter